MWYEKSLCILTSYITNKYNAVIIGIVLFMYKYKLKIENYFHSYTACNIE